MREFLRSPRPLPCTGDTYTGVTDLFQFPIKALILSSPRRRGPSDFRERHWVPAFAGTTHQYSLLELEMELFDQLTFALGLLEYLTSTIEPGSRAELDDRPLFTPLDAAYGSVLRVRAVEKRSPARHEPPQTIRATAVPRTAVIQAIACRRAERLLDARQREYGRCRPPTATAALPTLGPSSRRTVEGRCLPHWFGPATDRFSSRSRRSSSLGRAHPDGRQPKPRPGHFSRPVTVGRRERHGGVGHNGPAGAFDRCTSWRRATPATW